MKIPGGDRKIGGAMRIPLLIGSIVLLAACAGAQPRSESDEAVSGRWQGVLLARAPSTARSRATRWPDRSPARGKDRSRSRGAMPTSRAGRCCCSGPDRLLLGGAGRLAAPAPRPSHRLERQRQRARHRVGVREVRLDRSDHHARLNGDEIETDERGDRQRHGGQPAGARARGSFRGSAREPQARRPAPDAQDDHRRHQADRARRDPGQRVGRQGRPDHSSAQRADARADLV